MTTDVISPDLKATRRRLKLSRMLDTLPERLTLARQQKMPHQDLRLVLSDEVARRESLAVLSLPGGWTARTEMYSAISLTRTVSCAGSSGADACS